MRPVYKMQFSQTITRDSTKQMYDDRTVLYVFIKENKPLRSTQRRPHWTRYLSTNLVIFARNGELRLSKTETVSRVMVIY